MISREYFGSDGSYHQILAINDLEMKIKIQKIENNIKSCKLKKEKTIKNFFSLFSKLFL